VRRFRCREKTCSRRTFAEQVPLLVDRYARRTRRLRSDFEAIGLMLGGRPGSRLSSRQKKPTSRMTLLRLVRALPEPEIETPQVLGVDEFAFRRGRRYGTIVIDGDDHHVIDLLEDPSAEALVGWLTEHPGAQVICRDRDGVYASAARRGAPTGAAICRRLDGLPLAIELAAGRAKVLLLEALLARLDRGTAVLGDGPRVAPDRHQSLAATLAWSQSLQLCQERASPPRNGESAKG
jgi:hypothetical protein